MPQAKPPAAAFQSLVEDSEQGMILTDAAGIIRYANPASERLLGHAAAALIGRLSCDLCHADDRARAREAFGQCLNRPGMTIPLRLGIMHQDASIRALDVRLVNRLSRRGVKAVAAYFHPAQEAAAGDHYREVFERAPIGLGVADLDGLLLLFNEAMMRPGGYRTEDILAIGNVARLYFETADRDRVLALAAKQGFVWRHEVQFVRKNGEPYDALLTLAPVWFGNRSCWLAAVEDITEQKRAEAEQRRLEVKLVQAEKMEAVGRMTAEIAHDFNNVLAVILSSSALMADALPPEQASSQYDLQELRRAASLGAAMVRKLLGYARSAALKMAPTDLGPLVEGMRGMLRHVVPSRMTIDVRGAPGHHAMVDSTAIEQILLNLVTNARDAIPDAGTIRVDVVGTQPSDPLPVWLPPSSYVRLSVQDNGTGMDEVTRARALEPFFTTKAPEAGTGLGLSMVFGLAKQQRGFVEVQSELGAGTTVNLFFPRVPAPV